MSKIEVNTIEPQCGTTLTLGGCGQTVTLGSGASQSGFGRTGTVDWVTTVQTSTITAATGKGYFVNTTGGAITANLPAGAAGSIVAFRDYANTFDSNALTIAANGSEKINGSTIDLTVNTEGESITLVYADSTKGWLVVNDGNNDAGSQAQYVTATGGNSTATCGDYKIHTFTSPGTFCVSCAGNPSGSTTVEYVVVAGGGGAGASAPTNVMSGAGGAGGFRFASPSLAPLTYPAKPLAGPAALPVTATGYPVTVGAGGAGGSYCAPSAPGYCGAAGSNSVFTGTTTITSAGGGGGARFTTCGGNGGSGGGGSQYPGQPTNKGTGNTPPVSPPQGNPGGNGRYCGPDGSTNSGGGGGGAGAAGSDATSEVGGAGGSGAGLPAGFGSNGEPCGSYRYYAGGGRGGNNSSASPLAGAIGGGGNGMSNNGTQACGAGVANTGGGGGGVVSSPSTTPNKTGGAGGSGIVLIRYKFQN